MDAEKKGFVAQMSATFKGEKTSGEFLQELKALTYADKVWYAKELNNAGIPTADPLKPTVAE